MDWTSGSSITFNNASFFTIGSHTVSIGVTPFTQAGGAVLALEYTNRVTADGGYYEGVDCMIFKLDDLDSTTITKDYSFCYYESDEPGICVEWDDIID